MSARNKQWFALAVVALTSCGGQLTGDSTKGGVSAASAGGSGPGCPGSGWYCGQSGFGGDPTHLYYCPPGSSVSIDLGQCGDGKCHVAPNGSPDFCDGGSSNSSLPDPGFGFWCGGGGTPYNSGASGHLYFFDNSGTDLGACSNGCQVAPPGFADYCKPSHRPCSFYGSQSEGPDMSKATYAHIHGLRIGHILPRGHATWDAAALAPYDAEAQRAAAAGIEIVGLINNESVPWGHPQSEWNAPPDASGMNAYVQLFVDNATALMTHFAGQIKYWEIWNEPNHCNQGDDHLSICMANPQGAGASFVRPDIFAKMLAETYLQNEALIKANGLHLVLGGIYAHDLPWHYVADDYLRAVYGNGVWAWMHANKGRSYVWDNFAFHVYTTLNGAVSGGTISDYMNQLASVRGAAGDHSHIFMTEFGWITSQVSEGTQAANLDTELSVLEGRSEVDKTFVFRITEWPNPGWGIFRADGTRKPAVDVYWNHTNGCR